VSRGLRWGDNREQDVELRDTLQRACVEQLDGDAGHLRQESNQRNEYEQSLESSQSNSTNDAGDSSTATRATSNGDAEHTSFPCAHCNDYDPRDNTNTDYIAARSSEGQDPRSWVWGGYEPRDFKQAYADSRDSIERCTGIPAGVTV
jgi:hypothetical protein